MDGITVRKTEENNVGLCRKENSGQNQKNNDSTDRCEMPEHGEEATYTGVSSKLVTGHFGDPLQATFSVMTTQDDDDESES